MKTLKPINIKNCPYYFFNSMTNIKNLDTNLLSINQISFTSTDSVIFDIKYFKNPDSVNYLYLINNDVGAYFEEYNENKYLVFALADKNRKALENYKEPWSEIKDQIELIIDKKPIEYKKDFVKNKFESDDLSLGKMLNIPVGVIIVRSVFQKNNSYYPQVFLHECFYE